IAMNVDRGDTCREMVIRGLGYAIMPARLLQGIEDTIYQIEVTKDDGTPHTRPTWMFYHESSLEQNVVKAFVNFVKEQQYNN
ncbi:substrate-binding domain-containing protein, partial [Aeromonas veronii]|nr:substrate-binding domain-containing protein [Aeromonas veronii]